MIEIALSIVAIVVIAWAALAVGGFTLAAICAPLAALVRLGDARRAAQWQADSDRQIAAGRAALASRRAARRATAAAHSDQQPR